MVSWAVYREGSVAAWVRRDLEALLAPYQTGKRHRRDAHLRRKKH
jgi:hypothetical protein